MASVAATSTACAQPKRQAQGPDRQRPTAACCLAAPPHLATVVAWKRTSRLVERPTPRAAAVVATAALVAAAAKVVAAVVTVAAPAVMAAAAAAVVVAAAARGALKFDDHPLGTAVARAEASEAADSAVPRLALRLGRPSARHWGPQEGSYPAPRSVLALAHRCSLPLAFASAHLIAWRGPTGVRRKRNYSKR